MKLLLVDFSAIFWRNWHASGDAEVNFARRRTADMIRHHAGLHDKVAICFDSPNCWRRNLWAGYKATREPHDALSLEQLRLAVEDARGVEHYFCAQADEYEADDLIGDLTRTFGRVKFIDQHEVEILSSDKDFLQLLGPRVTMWHLARDKRVAADDVRGLTGVGPESIALWLALCGDKSDNILGVEGVGPKRAAQLIAEYGDLGGIRRAVEDDPSQFTPALSVALRSALTRTDCPLRLALQLTDLSRGDLPPIIPSDRVIEWVYTPTPKTPTPTPRTPMTTHDTDDYDEPAITPQAPSLPALPALQAPPAPPPPPPPSEPRSSVTLTPPGEWARQLEPIDARAAFGLAKLVVESRMFAAFGSPAQALLVLMAGREFGLGAMASLRSFHVVEGRPTMSAQAMMGLCLAQPNCAVFRVLRSKCTIEEAHVEIRRVGWETSETYTWTMDDAKRAGLAGRGPWQKYPRDMLINRCIAEAARFGFPEIMAGVYSPEEM